MELVLQIKVALMIYHCGQNFELLKTSATNPPIQKIVCTCNSEHVGYAFLDIVTESKLIQWHL